MKPHWEVNIREAGLKVMNPMGGRGGGGKSTSGCPQDWKKGFLCMRYVSIESLCQLWPSLYGLIFAVHSPAMLFICKTWDLVC